MPSSARVNSPPSQQTIFPYTTLFRSQPEFDGIIAAYRPDPDEHEAAERILAAVDEPLLYARVDLVRGLDRLPQLIELELIEPDLYLRDRKSTRLNSSHGYISYAVFCSS